MHVHPCTDVLSNTQRKIKTLHGTFFIVDWKKHAFLCVFGSVSISSS
jgi:hypothetical protein